MSIASRIQARLDALGLSERAAAAEAGLSPASVNKILNGVSESPRVATLEALAPVLRCSVVHLVTGRPDNPAGSVPVAPFALGMTLRDWMAGQAAAGMMADAAFRGDDFAEVCASQAYQVADAMLAERAKAVRS